MGFEIIITARAEREYQEIIDYLTRRWTEKEVEAFRKKLDVDETVENIEQQTR